MYESGQILEELERLENEKNLPPFDILDIHGQPTSLIPEWAYLYLDP